MIVVTVARKPFGESVATNVLDIGTGAINVDACRIGTGGGIVCIPIGPSKDLTCTYGQGLTRPRILLEVEGLGRWPTNLILEHSKMCVEHDGKWSCGVSCPVAAVDPTDEGSAVQFFKQIGA